MYIGVGRPATIVNAGAYPNVTIGAPRSVPTTLTSSPTVMNPTVMLPVATAPQNQIYAPKVSTRSIAASPTLGTRQPSVSVQVKPLMNKPTSQGRASVGSKLASVELDFGFPPEKVNIAERSKGKRLLLVGLPGAFTPT
jgi:hypothetical protein